ncbi:MAG: hypothetical protein EBY75_09205, partial [Actinobacteria bacterium]|nr:hypothetical protein [Actinomycetota bacterium]
DAIKVYNPVILTGCPKGGWSEADKQAFMLDNRLENLREVTQSYNLKNAGDYSLVLSKPSVGSAKGSAPLNQTGSLLVAVS